MGKTICIIVLSVVCGLLAVTLALLPICIRLGKYNGKPSTLSNQSAFSSTVESNPTDVEEYIPQHLELNAANASLINEKDIVTLGTYEQDNNAENGAEDIEWIVLHIERGKALLISKYVLDVHPFNETDGEVYWENSDIRKWLSDEFYKTAFSKKDKEFIFEYERDDIKDNVFLLNRYETDMFFLADNDVKTSLTNYADSKTPLLETIDSWWLSGTTWYESSNAGVYIPYYGDPYAAKNNLIRLANEMSNTVLDYSFSRPTKMSGVRPSIWVSLE